MRLLLYHLLISIFRLSLKIFFNKIEIEGQEKIPSSGPLIFVSNHNSALVDPLLVLCFLPRHPRMLAKSTLWKNPGTRFLMVVGKAIPIFRSQDKNADSSKNRESFKSCYKAIAAGDSIALFPEGLSHNAPALQPLKTGVARIALGSENQYGPLGLKIIPLGITFDNHQKFRSRVVIRVNDPIDVVVGGQSPDDADPDQVNALTQKIAQSLTEVTLNYPSWEEAKWINKTAELYFHRHPQTGLLGESEFTVKKKFTQIFEMLKQESPEQVVQIVQKIQDYEEFLSILSLKNPELIHRYPKSQDILYIIKGIFFLFIRFPLAIIGILLNFLPFWITRGVSFFVLHRQDRMATAKIMTGLMVYPLTWILWGMLIGLKTSASWGWFGFLLGPGCGLIALKFLDHRQQLFQEMRAYLILRSHHKMVQEVETRTQVVLEKIKPLLEHPKFNERQNPIKIRKLDHFVLTVRNLDESIKFYKNALGLEIINFADDRKALQFGHQKINLHEEGNEYEPKAQTPLPGSADFCLISRNPIEQVKAHLEKLQIPVEQGPVSRTGAMGPLISLYIRDPDHNLIEIANPVKSEK